MVLIVFAKCELLKGRWTVSQSFNGIVRVLSSRFRNMFSFSNSYFVYLFLKRGRCVDIVRTYFIVAK